MSKKGLDYQIGQNRAARGEKTRGFFPSHEQSRGYDDTKVRMNTARAEEKARQQVRKGQ